MSGRVDLVTGDAGRDVRRRHARDLAASIVQQLHRLTRIAQIHALDNEATRRQIEITAETLRDYHVRAAEGASLFFARGYVYFGGEPLKARRDVYEIARELEQILARCGGSELSFSTEVSAVDLRRFAAAIVTVIRDPRARYADHEVPNIRVRSAASATVLRSLGAETLGDDERLVRAYASAIVILRRFHEDLVRGVYVLPRRIKRIAQTLVDLSEGSRPSFLGVTSVRNANHDLAGQAVNTTILAVAAARQLTDDRIALTRIAMAAMLQDVGLPRAIAALAIEDDESPVLSAKLSDQADAGLPAGTAGVLTALGRVNDPTIVRTVIAYEALWLRRTQRLGPVHRGLRPATLHARIVATARAYNELLTPRPGEPPKTPEEAILALDQEAGGAIKTGFADAADRTALRLLMAALGMLPPGMLVELTSGEIAVVVEHRRGTAPKLRVVVDASGAITDPKGDFRLASDDRQIVRIVASDPSFLARRGSDPESGPRPAERAMEAFSSGRLQRAHEVTRAPGEVAASPSPPPPTDADATIITQSPFEGATERGAVPQRLPVVPEGRSADVEGSLSRTPLPNLLVHVLARSLTGSLVLKPDATREFVLVFENSVPLKVGGDFKDARIGDLLVTIGAVDVKQLAASLANARRTGKPIGRQLVVDGVLRADRLADALERQMESRLRVLAGCTDGTYAFHRGHDVLVGPHATEPTPVDPLAAILVTARTWNDAGRIDATLRAVEGRKIALHPAATLKRFKLDDREREALDSAIARQATWAEIQLEDPESLALLRPVVYTLAVTRHLDLGTAEAWPLAVEKREGVPDAPSAPARHSFPPIAGPMRGKSDPPAPSSSPSSSRPLAPRATASMAHLPLVAPSPPAANAPVSTSAPLSTSAPAKQASEKIATRPPPPASASGPSSVRESLREPRSIPPPPKAARLNTPSPIAQRASMPPPSLADTRRTQIVERARAIDSGDLYALLGVAKQATQQEIQAAYIAAAKMFHPDRLPAELADLKDTTTRLFGALSDAHKTLTDAEKRAAYDKNGAKKKDESDEVHRMLKAANDYQKAEVMLRRSDVAEATSYAQLAVDGDPSRSEHVALLGWLKSMATGPNAIQEGLVLLNKAVEMDKDYDRALFWRGSLLKKLGKVEAAMKDFKHAAEVNPKNIDAVREVRLANMRSGQTSDRPQQPSGGGFLSRFFGKKS